MKEILPGLFEVKLASDEKSTMKINIFIIPGGPRNRVLMIDAGLRSQKNKEIMTRELEEAGIPFNKLDIFITHKHFDHTGLAGFFAARGATIYMNPEEDRHAYDCTYFNSAPKALEEQQGVLRSVGVTKEMTPTLYDAYMELNREMIAAENATDVSEEKIAADTERPSSLNINKTLFSERQGFSYVPLHINQCFQYGEYKLFTMPLKGHTYGQMGLYDKGHKIVFCADQFIPGIIPIVGTSFKDEHILQSYLSSLETFRIRFRNWMIYPAHNEPYLCEGDVAATTLKAYQNKMNQILNVLDETRKKFTIKEVAFKAYNCTDESALENIFETKLILSKTFSCLEYLYEHGMVNRDEVDGTLYWRYGFNW